MTVPFVTEEKKEIVFELKTHICNCCGNKGETYSFQSDGGTFFNLCVSCVPTILQRCFDDMSLPEISDMLRKQ